MTTAEQVQKAKILIQQKRYDDARAILQNMKGNTIAQKWLARLNEIDPPVSTMFELTEDDFDDNDFDSGMQKSKERSSKSKYSALRTVMIVYKFFALLIGLGGTAFSAATLFDNFFAGIASFVSTAIVVVTIYASAELIEVLLDLERNTRTTAEFQERMYQAQLQQLEK